MVWQSWKTFSCISQSSQALPATRETRPTFRNRLRLYLGNKTDKRQVHFKSGSSVTNYLDGDDMIVTI